MRPTKRSPRRPLTAQADEFIRALPEGYLTRVGERGVKLSGGQRQRIAIARALLIDPRVLVMDDSTSSVDSATEAAIRSQLDALMTGRTTFIVAQRLSTAKRADVVLVMDGGRLVASGTHDELLAEQLPVRRDRREPAGRRARDRDARRPAQLDEGGAS